MPSSSYEFKESNWEKIKDFIVQNQADVILVIGIILIALISFGLGRLTAPQVNKEPVVIEKQGTGNLELGTGSVLNSAGQSLNQGAVEQGSTSTDSTTNQSASQQAANSNNSQGIIVASKNSNKYHWPWCAAAKNIKPENQIWFKSEAEAKAAGYTPSDCFSKSPPAGYKSDLTK
jgi:hypothetical protein